MQQLIFEEGQGRSKYGGHMRKASPPPLSLSLSLHVVGGVQVKERKRSMGVTKVQFYWC
jgi:hypothetical protein